MPKLIGVKQIAAGWEHSCAILADGHVTCWGSNSHGQVGAGDPQEHGPKVVWSPRPVQGIERAAELALGYGHTCVRTEEGKVICWGDRFTCEGPAPVEGWGIARRISSGGGQTCIEQTDGTISCACGQHFSREPDLCGGMDDRMTLLPIPEISHVLEFRVGGAYYKCGMICMLKVDHSVTCVDSTTFAPFLPEVMKTDSLRDIVQISAGAWHACALRADHRVFCWGHGESGQLGDGGRQDRSSPVEPVWAPGASP